MGWLASPEFKVGVLVVAVSGLIGGMAMKVAEGPGMFKGEKVYFFRADNAGGLVTKSAVKMAGIKIGVIKDIVLDNGRARIELAVDPGAHVTESSRVEMRSDGILGDKHVELIPGKEEDIELPPGSEITVSQGRGGMDDLMGDVSRMARSFNELVEVLRTALKEGDDTTSVGRIVGNIEKLTSDLKQITAENKDNLRDIVDRVKNVAKNIDTYINEESLARVDRSLKNIEEITAKINNGQGTLGRLINDEQTIDELNTAITNVNNFLGGAEKMETSIDFHSEFMTNDENKSFLGIKIQPGLDRYYELDLISDTRGVINQEIDSTTINGGPAIVYNTTKTYVNSFKVTGLFAKNFWDFTIKGGIIENYGGVALDYFPLGYHNLMFSNEFFEFQALQWRSFLRYSFFKGFYLVAGGDNMLGKDQGYGGPHGPAAFLGAGVFISNDDLKMLATKFSFR